MKLLVDMNMSPLWPDVFGARGIEATHWSSIGRADADDIQIMAYALQHGFVVSTNDLDFGHLLAITNAKGPSVIQIRVGNLRPEVIGGYVADVLNRMREHIETGILLTIEPERARVRVLPIRG